MILYICMLLSNFPNYLQSLFVPVMRLHTLCLLSQIFPSCISSTKIKQPEGDEVNFVLSVKL